MEDAVVADISAPTAQTLLTEMPSMQAEGFNSLPANATFKPIFCSNTKELRPPRRCRKMASCPFRPTSFVRRNFLRRQGGGPRDTWINEPKDSLDGPVQNLVCTERCRCVIKRDEQSPLVTVNPPEPCT